MSKDNLYIGEEGKQKLISGIRKVASAVGGTMGTGGSNAIIEAIENPGHIMTNDGFSIANAVKLTDPIEDMGKKILLESINRANKASGDGSSTTCVLTAAIIEEGMKRIGKGMSPMDVKRSLEDCVPFIEESIKNQKKEITVDDVHKVASISAEDEAIGALIGEIYKKIGKDGVIYWDISKTPEDTYTIGTGITVEGAGYASPYLADIDEKTGNFLNVARWKNPYVLITKQKITSAAELGPLFEKLFNKEIKEVVVFCDEIEAPVIGDLVQTRAVRGFKTLVVKMPVIWKDQWYEDLAKASGATVIDPIAGVTFKTMNESHLGRFEHITVTKEDTFIDGIRDMSEHIKALQDEGSEDSQLRASRLNTKTARLFIGAYSDSALSYKRLKVEDAIGASWNALRGGIVAGGGLALFNAARSIGGVLAGVMILEKALKSPMLQIMENAGIKKSLDECGESKGYNSKTGQLVDMFEAGIVDPANVVLNSVRNAISVAASIITSNVIVTLPRQEQPMNYPNMPLMR